MTNTEVWYRVTTKQIESLEAADERIIRENFSLHSKISRVFLYLEFAIVPIRFLIKVRRLLYLKWEPKDSLVYRFLQIMIKKPLVGDWINLVKQDLKDLEVNLNFDEIKRISKQEFKDKIKQKMFEKAFEYLILIKEKQSKLKDITYNKFETQHYLLLLPESLSKTEMSNAM